MKYADAPGTDEILEDTNPPVKLSAVDNVLFDLASITKKFYPEADIDYPDTTLKKIKKPLDFTAESVLTLKITETSKCTFLSPQKRTLKSVFFGGLKLKLFVVRFFLSRTLTRHRRTTSSFCGWAAECFR